MGKSKVINDPARAVSREQAAEAVRTLIRWAGDDPDRPGLAETPARVLGFYREFFTGYHQTPDDYAASIANDVVYDDFILVRDISVISMCEHHMLPATGTAHIAYIPGKKVAGIGTLAKIITDCAARLTTQEDIMNDALAMIERAYAPQGAAIYLRLSHGCMTMRGEKQTGSSAVTARFSGAFLDDKNKNMQNSFFMLVGAAGSTVHDGP